jgi:SulP family sulfate permease
MSVYFGSINHIQNRIARIVEGEQSVHILIVGSGINLIDLAGVEALVAENRRLERQGGGLYFVGLKSSVYEFVAKAHMVRDIGRDHFFDGKTDAIRQLFRRLDPGVCETCSARIFNECP